MKRNTFVATLCLALSLEGAALAAGSQALPRHVPGSAAGQAPVGRLAATDRLDLALALPLRNQPGLTQLLQDLYNPASPSFHQYLSPEQFAEQFGPTVQDYQALIAFAQAHHLAVVEKHPNRTLLHVQGSVADIEQAFHVTMQLYQHPTENRKFYAPDTAPSIDIGIPVLDIRGLENYDRPHPLLKTKLLDQSKQMEKVTAQTGSGVNGTFLGYDFRNAYAPGVTLSGTGQSVALFEMDGYYTNDIIAYETAAGLPNVTLTNVLLGGFDGNPFDQNAVVEVSLDIEMAIAMAPGLARVMVYEAPLTSAGAYDILNRMATDNLAKQISSSWVIDRIVTNPVPNQIYQQYSAQGQSFFQASGDQGAYYPGVFQTADNPYITTVGGTTLTTTGPGGAWLSEMTWFGSGGGVSTTFAIPSYQKGIDMSANLGSTTMRNVPDVALTADNVEVIADSGSIYSVGGTSCAAPLWAGFTALINQQALANGRAPMGFINPAIYALGQQAGYTLGLHDITTGNNTSPFSPNLFFAVPGYDLCTGWGTPNGSNLINALVAPVDALQVSPGLGFAASGPPGGPFTPSAQSYSLKNGSGSPINWTLVNTSAWLTASSTGGQLTPGGLPAVVTVGLNAAASNLLAGNYSTTIVISNLNDGFAQTRQFTLQVATAPVVITAQPTNQSVLVGATARFYVTATGTALHYAWQKNGIPLADGGHISGSATSALTVSNVALADAGVYSVVVSNLSGQATSLGAALVVYSPGGGQLVQNGGFETGNFSGWTLSGNTNLTAVSTNSFAVHSGTYGAQFGPAGSLGYLSQTIPTVPGGSYVVSIWLDSPDGRAPNEFVVQWGGTTIYDEANLGALGWTNLQFIVTATGASTVLEFGLRDDPSYLALDDISVVAVTNIASPPILTSQPLGQQVLAGATATFSVTAQGSAPLGYRWQLNGTNLSNGGNLSGATTGQLVISNVGFANAGTYSLMVSNTYGVALSAGALLAVLPSGALIITFDDLPDTSNGNAVTNGYNGLNWENFYEIDGPALTGQFGPSGYSAGVVSPNNVAYNGGGTAASISTAGEPFNLYSAYLTAGWNDNLQVLVRGFSGASNLVVSKTCILSATEPTLFQFNFSNVTEVDFTSSGGTPHPGYAGSGEHFVLDNLAIAFNGPVLITQQPAGQSVAAGETATFSVGAIGSVPLSFQWQKNGANLSDGPNISGAKTSALTISNAALASAGVYSVLVSNSFGQVNSAGAPLTVLFLAPTSLVANGGFETGDFTSWTQFGNTNYSMVTSNSEAVHSGTYGAELGPISPGYLEQILPTVPGASYRLSLWLKALPPAGFNFFDIYWNGSFLFEEFEPAPGTWNQLEFLVTAISSSSTLEFGFENDQSFFALDDVSLNLITNTAAPPAITNQPVAQAVPVGGTASFHVGAGGAAPLGYQWQMNGTNLTDGGAISGAASASLTIGNVSAANLGTYSVLVSNAFGTAMSLGVPMTLLPAGALVINFDDLPETLYGITITNGYQGLNWTNFAEIDGLNAASYQPGAAAGVVSPNNLAYSLYNSFTGYRASFSSTGPISVYSAYVTAAFDTTYPLAVLGYAGASLVYSNYYILNDTTPTLLTLNFTNVTQVSFVPVYIEPFLVDNIAVSFSGPVAILTQPVSQEAFVGQNAAFSVTAVGSLPLAYQWQKNGLNLSNGGNVSGANSSRLVLSSVTLADAGNYSVIVSNSYGPLASAPAALAVASLGATNLVLNGGFESGDFTNWTLYGDFKSSYVTTNPVYVHSGNYGAQLGPYNSYGELQQYLPTTPGATYLLSFALQNQPPVGYNYLYVYWNGLTLFNQFDLLTFDWTNLQFLVTANSTSSYIEFNFDNDLAYFGLDDISVTPVTSVASPPTIARQPVSLILPAGANATFPVNAAGSGPLAYQWRMNGTNLIDGGNISGSTSNVLTVTSVSPARVGTYSVTVTNAYGATTSAGATLALLPAGEQIITFDDLPDNYSGILITNGYAGLNWDQLYELDGTVTPDYQPGSTNGVISPNNIAVDESGYPATISSPIGFFGLMSAYVTAAYYNQSPLQVLGYAGAALVYSNTYYLSTTNPTLLTLNYTNVSQVQFFMAYNAFILDSLVVTTNVPAFVGPTITNQPVSQLAALGGAATFQVSAIGSPPLGYRWFFNGTSLTNGGNISGATSTQLTVSNAAVANIGAYSVVVTNLYGSATSAVATLNLYSFGTNNLIQNGGFETGDFTGWTQSGDPKNVYVTNAPFYAHSGVFGAQLGPYNYAYLSQTVPTTPGGNYLLSFWLHPDGLGYFAASWNYYFIYGDYPPASGWTNVQFVVTATSSSTTLEFEFYDAPGYMGLDDVSLTSYILISPPAAVPVQILSPQLSGGNFTFGFQTVSGQSYTIQQCTNLPAAYWSACTNITGTGSPYLFSIPANPAQPEIFFRVKEP